MRKTKGMSYEEVLKYCHFFKGEISCPKSYDNKHEGKLWRAEQHICEYMPSLVDGTNPRVSFARVIYAYIGKWDPYGVYDVMETYFEKCPDLRSEIF